jgi:hypothetical protein
LRKSNAAEFSFGIGRRVVNRKAKSPAFSPGFSHIRGQEA